MLLRIKTGVIMLVSLLTVLILSSCAFIPTDISELESPPKLTAEQQAIEKALEASVTGKLTLRYPLEGKYRGAFVPKVLDNNEALAFYSSDSKGPQIAVLDKMGNNWKVINNISSEGNEIDSLEFGDFNGDGHKDIAVGWRSYTSTDLTLMVYMRSGSSFYKVPFNTFTKMVTLDMNGDGKMDILTLKLDSDVTQAKARLISYKNGRLAEVSNSPLDSTVTRYSGVYTTKLGKNKNVVLIDGYKSTNKMITEIVYYKNGKLNSPLYSREKQTVNSTMRFDTKYKCTDINNDGITDIPMMRELPTELNKSSTNQNWLVRWSDFTGSNVLTLKVQTIMNYAQNYYLKYPAKWESIDNNKIITFNVTVSSRADDDSVWNICKWDAAKKAYGKVFFTIYVKSEDDWSNITDKSNYFELAEKNGTVYLAQIPEQAADDPLALSASEIKHCFNLIN